MNKRNDGCVYTRRWVVRMMLDICGYVAEDCLFLMTLTDPSCGDGVFVTEAVERLCLSARNHDIGLERALLDA